MYERSSCSIPSLAFGVISPFSILAIVLGEKQYLNVVSICISLTTNDVEHLFMCLLAILISYFVRFPFSVLKLACLSFCFDL